METTAHFENIPQEIAKQLRAAAQEIVVAAASFTDRDLFDLLCKQAGRGVRVRLAVLNDQINIGPGRLNFQRLQDIGGQVFLIPVAGDHDPIMHHKFCVIDGETVIIGSYNWTLRAQDNDESITVIADGPEIAADYLNAFDALLCKHGLGTPAIDQAQVRRRLEIVRNLLLLDEWETLAPQLDKLRPAGAALPLEPLLTALDSRDSGTAVAWIADYLQRATALTIAGDQEIGFLRLTLRGLEYQVTALSDEKAEIERLVHAFSLGSSQAIGDLMTSYLRLRAQKLRHRAEDDREAEPEADSARTDYEEYRDANDEARETPEPPKLSPDDLQELWRIYREASQKCHPDKVDEADREHANRLFVQIQAAYRNNDLAGVRAIHAAVRQGHMFVDRSITLTETESLGHAIAELRRDLDQLAAQIHQLRQSDAYQTLKDLADWDAYFAGQRVTLEQAIEHLQAELAALRKQAETDHAVLVASAHKALATANRQLRFSSQALARVEQERYIEFFATHPQASLAFIRVVSWRYPLTETMVEHYADRWDWGWLSANEALPWSEALIEHFADRLDWEGVVDMEGLSSNEALPWSEALIEHFADRWDWRGLDSLVGLSSNKALPWSEALIERYADRWDWHRLSRNASLPWSEALIDRYADRWCWGSLSGNAALPWSEALIERYADRWDWHRLSRNASLPWSEAFINWYCYEWKWGVLSSNKALPWSDAIIERYADRWDWAELSANEALPWREALIARYVYRWDWEQLSANKALPWREALIERYADRWDWAEFGRNECLPWSEALIERYADRWDWEELSANEALPWREALIDRYADRWCWGSLSGNAALPWSDALIDRYADRWCWGTLSRNGALPWSEALIKRYADRWDWSWALIFRLGTILPKWSESSIREVMENGAPGHSVFSKLGNVPDEVAEDNLIAPPEYIGEYANDDDIPCSSAYSENSASHRSEMNVLTYADFTQPRTLTAMIAGTQVTVRLPVFGHRPILVDGIEAPACKFWQYLARQERVSEESMVREARNALIDRVVLAPLIAVTLAPKESDHVIAEVADSRNRRVSIVIRQEYQPFRPLLSRHRGLIARFDERLILGKDLLYRIIAEVKKWDDRGLFPIGGADRTIYFLPSAEILDLIDTIGISGQAGKPGVQGRLGTLLKRPGGRSDTFDFSGLRAFPKSDSDGTVAISRLVEQPYQGTLVSANGAILKGIVRPPLVVNSKSGATKEPEGFCCDAQFERKYDGAKASFHICRRFRRERATLCYQAVLFGFAEPARFIEDQNEQLGDAGFVLRMLGLGNEGRRKLKCGIPAGLLVGWNSAFKRLMSFEVDASRAVVFGSDLVDIGKVRLLPGTYREFSKKYRRATGRPLQTGGQVVLHRDPALPDSSSMHVFTYAGQAVWATDSSSGIGVVLNPADPHWRRSGGDFDGDAAVIFPLSERHALRPTLLPMDPDPPPPGSSQVDGGESRIEDAVVELADIPWEIRGNSISICTILAERGELHPDIAVLGAWVIQRAFDARKHPVALGALLDFYEKLKRARTVVEPVSCLSEVAKKPKRAIGYDARKAAWGDLVEWAKAAPPSMCAIEKAMVARILRLDDLFRELGFLRARYEIPKPLIMAARAELEEKLDGDEQRSRMEDLTALYLRKERYQRINPAAAALGPETGRDELCSITAEVEGQYRSGILSAAAVIAYGVHGWAAKLVSASEIERIAAAVPSEGVVYLEGHDWRSGVYEIDRLRPAPSVRGDFALLVKAHRFAEIRILESKPKSTKVWLRASEDIRPDRAHGENG